MYKSNNIKKQGSCLICFNDLLDSVSLTNIFSLNKICDKCLNSFKHLNIHKKIIGTDVWFLYEYNAFIKKLIYQYKGCYDIELKDVFLNKYKKIIKRKYKGYTIIFPPSNKEDNLARGFLHIEEIIKTLKMKYEILFYKKENYKQSNLKYNERKNVEHIIDVIDKKKITNKKYLIFDDIYTSGSTLKTIIKILLKNNVKKENISSIIIAKTPDFVEI